MWSLNIIRVAFIFIFSVVTLAQNTTLSVFLLDTDPQPLVASVVSANAATTSLAIGCPPGEDSSECGFGPGLDLEHISGSIWQASITGEGVSFSWSCQIEVTSAVCITSAGGAAANDPGMTTTTLDASEIMSFPVTVTAGANSLSTSGAETTTTGSGVSGGDTASKNMPTASTISMTAASNTKAATSSNAASAGGWSNGGFGAEI